MSIATTLYKEGATSLIVPRLIEEPRKSAVFFNRRGAFVRDVSIICCKATLSSLPAKRGISFADSLAGIGARGIRVANEIDGIKSVFLNDISSGALGLARKSAELNSLQERCLFSHEEACSFLASRSRNSGDRFDFTDVDPFGTPSDFVDCAIRSVKDGGVLSMTATDSGVLCGVYPRVALRKYLGYPLRTEYSHEIGMRLLFGLVAQTAMRFETGIEPLFCHHDMQYFRIYVKIRVGNSYSRENEEKIGFVLHCFNCGYRSIVRRSVYLLHKDGEVGRQRNAKMETSTEDRFQFLQCPVCKRQATSKSGRLAVGGPLWIGNIESEEFVSRCHAISALPVFNSELGLPLYYNLNAVSLKRGSSMPKISLVAEKLRSLGFLASRTRLNPNSLRTNATKGELQSVVYELAR